MLARRLLGRQDSHEYPRQSKQEAGTRKIGSALVVTHGSVKNCIKIPSPHDNHWKISPSTNYCVCTPSNFSVTSEGARGGKKWILRPDIAVQSYFIEASRPRNPTSNHFVYFVVLDKELWWVGQRRRFPAVTASLAI